MKAVIVLIICLTTTVVSSQIALVKLPSIFKQLKFGVTTIDDLKTDFKKPDTILNFVVEEFYSDGGGGLSGTMDACYDKDKLVLHFKLNETTIIPQLFSIDILAGSPVKIEDSIYVGKSTRQQVSRMPGTAVSSGNPAVDENMLRYNMAGNLLCVFYFEHDILTLVRIMRNPATE